MEEKAGRKKGYKPRPEDEEFRLRKIRESRQLNSVQRKERDDLIYELRLSGYSASAIGDKVGMSESNVKNVIDKQLKRRHQPLIEELRQLELDRLDKYLRHLEAQIAKGSTIAIQTALRVADRRAKLLGLDMDHLKVNPNTGELTSLDLELQDLISSAKAQARMRAQELDANPRFEGLRQLNRDNPSPAEGETAIFNPTASPNEG